MCVCVGCVYVCVLGVCACVCMRGVSTHSYVLRG